jgi:hypothetical protein
MLKMTASGKDGRHILVLGLSFGNLDRLRADAPDGFITVLGVELGLPVDVVIFAGETEASMAHHMRELIGPETKVTVSDKLKS